jgi:hypothetical protein
VVQEDYAMARWNYLVSCDLLAWCDGIFYTGFQVRGT